MSFVLFLPKPASSQSIGAATSSLGRGLMLLGLLLPPSLPSSLAHSLPPSLAQGQRVARTIDKASFQKPATAKLSTKATKEGTGLTSNSNRGYVVGPDDVIKIIVVDTPQFSVEQAIIPEDGQVTFPVVGTLTLTGMTVEQIDVAITKGLKKRMVRPEVEVSIIKRRPQQVFVLGPVKNPGPYELKSGWRVTQALSAAGGLAVESDLAAVVVSRNNQKLLDAALLPLLNDPAVADNALLKTGDVLRFYERKVNVSVAGAVVKPGIFSLPIGSGVAQAVGLAGGALPSAARTRVSLRRANGSVLTVNLFKAMALKAEVTNGVDAKGSDANPIIVEGDVITVPEQTERFTVLGAVEKPGFFFLDDARQMRIRDALVLAGGAKSQAALTKARLRHGDGTEVSLDLYQLQNESDDAHNLVLRPDDVLSIPEARGITVVGEVNRPGSYPLEMGKAPHISDAIAVAGGLKITAETARISVARTLNEGKFVTINVDPVGLLKFSDLSQNAALQDGDVVSVTALQKMTVHVSGEVKTPGAYVLTEGAGIAALVISAGGPTPDAALSSVSVTGRDGISRQVDSTTTLLEGGKEAGGPLFEGDVVIVPRSEDRILVVGAVTDPGSYALPKNRELTVGDALDLAGGPDRTARVKSLTLLRSQGPKVVKTIIRIDSANKGTVGTNFLVQKGDVIYVPEGTPKQSTVDIISRFAPGFAMLIR